MPRPHGAASTQGAPPYLRVSRGQAGRPAARATVSIERMPDRLAAELGRIDAWGADHAAAAVVGPRGVVASRGDPVHRYRWASVTKLVTAWSVLIATERGLLALDEAGRAAGRDGPSPPRARVRAAVRGARRRSRRPGRRRIYSNPGYDALGALVAERAGVDSTSSWTVGSSLRSGWRSTVLVERPSQGLEGRSRT